MVFGVIFLRFFGGLQRGFFIVECPRQLPHPFALCGCCLAGKPALGGENKLLAFIQFQRLPLVLQGSNNPRIGIKGLLLHLVLLFASLLQHGIGDRQLTDFLGLRAFGIDS